MPDISIIIPNYNHTLYILNAIQSVINQTYASFEIIVVDDGSTDDSREVVSQFGDQIHYIWQENQGLAGARNTGIRAAHGEFIGLLDADDEWRPDYLETMVKLIQQNPEAAVYYCAAQCMDPKGNDLPQILGAPRVPPDYIFNALLRANFLIPSTIILRRSVIESVGLFDAALRSCEDWDLWLRMLPEQKFVGTPDCLVRYRVHNQSLSTNPAGMQVAARAVIEKNFGLDDRHPQSWTPEKRQAYGGLYRYYVLTSVQRQNDWLAAASYLKQALLADPTLAVDLDLYYDLALGSQPVGFRGTSHQLMLKDNLVYITSMIKEVFGPLSALKRESLRRETYGTAYFALGLVAYNSGHRGLSRQCLLRAVYFRPELIRDGRVIRDFVLTFISQSMLKRLKNYFVLSIPSPKS